VVLNEKSVAGSYCVDILDSKDLRPVFRFKLKLPRLFEVEGK
jgi:hypothetical protein